VHLIGIVHRQQAHLGCQLPMRFPQKLILHAAANGQPPAYHGGQQECQINQSQQHENRPEE